jgi:hypothetical protein
MEANNTQEFADKMTAVVMGCRAADIKQVAHMTGATEAAAWEAIQKYGCKWIAIDSLRKVN